MPLKQRHWQITLRPFTSSERESELRDHADGDAGARQGYCLYKVGCKGPVTYNACSTVMWNEGLSFPIKSGHGCIGCSEDDF